jgi:hypothetical protein
MKFKAFKEIKDNIEENKNIIEEITIYTKFEEFEGNNNDPIGPGITKTMRNKREWDIKEYGFMTKAMRAFYFPYDNIISVEIIWKGKDEFTEKELKELKKKDLDKLEEMERDRRRIEIYNEEMEKAIEEYEKYEEDNDEEYQNMKEEMNELRERMGR